MMPTLQLVVSRPTLVCLSLAMASSNGAAIASSPTQRLLRDGFVVLEDVLTPAEVTGVRDSAAAMLERGRMINLGQEGRDDAVVVLDPARLDHPSYGTLDVAAKVLLGLPDMLVASGKQDGVSAVEMAHLAEAAVPTRLMLAHYPASGGRYVPHLDNDPDDPSHAVGPIGLRACDRVFTCIIYLNDCWEEAHGGCLRIISSTSKELAQHGIENGEDDINPESSHVDIAPRGGRLVIFDSRRVLHEVRPSFASRWALTAWV